MGTGVAMQCDISILFLFNLPNARVVTPAVRAACVGIHPEECNHNNT